MSPTDVKIKQDYCRSDNEKCKYCGMDIPSNHQAYKYEASYQCNNNPTDTGTVCTSCAKCKEEVRVIYLYELAEKKHGR